MITDERKLILTLDFPPSVNHYWLTHGKRRFLSQRARDFRQHVVDLMPFNWEPFTGRLQLYIESFAPDRRIRDLDNQLKCLGDSLEHAGAYLNDNQIDKLTIIRKGVIPKAGKVIITLETLCA